MPKPGKQARYVPPTTAQLEAMDDETLAQEAVVAARSGDRDIAKYVLDEIWRRERKANRGKNKRDERVPPHLFGFRPVWRKQRR